MSLAIETYNKIINNKPALQYLIVVRPLGLFYGSAGKFLSSENLVGRSSVSFPPSAATVSSIFAHQLNDEPDKLNNLQLAEPFWTNENQLDNFYVPTPLNCLVKDGQIKYTTVWREWK